MSCVLSRKAVFEKDSQHVLFPFFSFLDMHHSEFCGLVATLQLYKVFIVFAQHVRCIPQVLLYERQTVTQPVGFLLNKDFCYVKHKCCKNAFVLDLIFDLKTIKIVTKTPDC